MLIDRVSMSLYRRNMLRLGIGAALLLCAPYLFSAGSFRHAKSTWDRLRAASAGPSLAVGVIMSCAGALRLARTGRRRFGAWARAQVEGPNIELFAVPVVCLITFVGGHNFGRSWFIGSLLCGAFISMIYGMRLHRATCRWDDLAGHTVCNDCGYIVSRVEGDRCPECGRHLAEAATAAPFGRDILLR